MAVNRLAVIIICVLLSVTWLVDGARLDDIQWHLDLSNGRELALNDFESGSMSPWYDESVGDAHWAIETYGSPEETNPAPQPQSGTKYLRVLRPAGTSGQAVLRTSSFLVKPGDTLEFSFWIRSQIIQTNNLEVYWSNGGNLERILSLVQYSTPSNFEWRQASVLIPALAPVQTMLSIFGFCSSGNVDGIAIDNIVVLASDQTLPPTTTGSTASTTSASSTLSTSTASTASTASSGNCPSNLGPNPMKCNTLEGKCYCFSLYKVNGSLEGETYCKSNGAQLISLESQAETAAIDAYISSISSGLDKSAYWTSGEYVGSGFTWKGSGQPFTYTNWYPGQPDNNAAGFCVRLFYGSDFAGRWSDIECSGKGYVPFYFICELN